MQITRGSLRAAVAERGSHLEGVSSENSQKRVDVETFWDFIYIGPRQPRQDVHPEQRGTEAPRHVRARDSTPKH